MSFTKTVMAAVVALAMTGAPALAQSAAPLSVAASAERSGAEVGDANQFLGDYGIPLAFFVAAIVAVVLLTGDDTDDLPASA